MHAFDTMLAFDLLEKATPTANGFRPVSTLSRMPEFRGSAFCFCKRFNQSVAVEPSEWNGAIVVLGCKGAKRYVDLRGIDYTIGWVKIMGKNTKIIQVPMEEELLKQIDTTASIVAEKRRSIHS